MLYASREKVNIMVSCASQPPSAAVREHILVAGIETPELD
jgi:hypothetical protein